MSKIDLLLKIDKSKLVRPIKDIEVKRLSEVLGEPFIVTCQALTADEQEEIQDNVSVNADGEVSSDKNIQIETVLHGVKDPDLYNKKVIEYFGAATAYDAVKKIFLPGEVTSIYNTITKISGFSKDAVKEIKNSSTQTEKSDSCTSSGKKEE
ncbi:phage tail assembly chaperone [Clostridium tyrobutyricum]|uniref:phage tail assembly chaperone n=1 Tax=Clostridium tyrobutyricum TaxID=1519 RepID=UPI001C38058A|nr:hypothetical protein [Clostridium tyrobutyricum]MBV4423242.1 hypothetical protein [Clostridium tyrobutyricum]